MAYAFFNNRDFKWLWSEAIVHREEEHVRIVDRVDDDYAAKSLIAEIEEPGPHRRRRKDALAYELADREFGQKLQRLQAPRRALAGMVSRQMFRLRIPKSSGAPRARARAHGKLRDKTELSHAFKRDWIRIRETERGNKLVLLEKSPVERV